MVFGPKKSISIILCEKSRGISRLGESAFMKGRKMMERTKKMMLKLAGMVMLFMLCMGAGKMVYAQTTITPPMLKVGSTKGSEVISI